MSGPPVRLLAVGARLDRAGTESLSGRGTSRTRIAEVLEGICGGQETIGPGPCAEGGEGIGKRWRSTCRLGVLARREERRHRTAVACDLHDSTALGPTHEVGKPLPGLSHRKPLERHRRILRNRGTEMYGFDDCGRVGGWA
jgi:hypothetical protein